ncbi:hypothetical protein C7H19_19795 [Aphanothece hegewaldii CCALA 016]|uniref:Uncharacterized protein n=1 Tax=Aphanothece hegewaldii CCALA 016 TaxID=2107694 RepID=A0A2T1LT79_9CHRO|nr:glycoside hydrolase family 19 protein [Aphanothece hegewaldii]PSF33631.1 hypothetical protein C7H19_19795 [Aphanothece hegewaldii CCALA 016]
MIATQTALINLDNSALKDIQLLLSRLGLYPENEIDGIYGPKTKRAWASFKQHYYLSDPDLIGPASYQKLKDESSKSDLLISRKNFDEVFRYAKDRDRDTYFLPINRTLREFQINTPKRIAAFLAQIGHESASLRYSEEIASGFAYEGRKDLGNIYKGDGVRYKGRGLIQLTGRANYRTVGKALGVDLEFEPTLVKVPIISARVAGYFWQSNGLNELADHNAFRRITKKINGGYNGIDDRVRRWERAKEILKC